MENIIIVFLIVVMFFCAFSKKEGFKKKMFGKKDKKWKKTMANLKAQKEEEQRRQEEEQRRRQIEDQYNTCRQGCSATYDANDDFYRQCNNNCCMSRCYSMHGFGSPDIDRCRSTCENIARHSDR